MTRLIILFALSGAAGGVAFFLQRRRPEPPTMPSYRAPAQVDRADFAPAAPDAVIIAVFTSATCSSCPAVWETVSSVAQPGVVEVERIDVQTDPSRHRRYKIDGVPTTLVIAPDGIVTHSHFGPVAVDTLREDLGLS